MTKIAAVCRHGLYRGDSRKFSSLPEVEPGTVPTKGGVTVRFGGAPEAGLISAWVLVGDVLHMWKGWRDVETTAIIEATHDWSEVLAVAYAGFPPLDAKLEEELSLQFPFEWELIDDDDESDD